MQLKKLNFNQSEHRPPAPGPAAHRPHPTHRSPKKRRNSKQLAWIILSVLAALGLTVGITLAATGVVDLKKVQKEMGETIRLMFSSDSDEPTVSEVTSGYWAVFLASNQVYFGKLTNKNAQFLVLTDVFYLRAQRRLQPPDESDEDGGVAIGQPRQQVQLIKLGDELHGPEDKIEFNRDNVLFVEQLKDDSRVVKGIEQFKAQ